MLVKFMIVFWHLHNHFVMKYTEGHIRFESYYIVFNFISKKFHKGLFIIIFFKVSFNSRISPKKLHIYVYSYLVLIC